jgi:hypothetical protein
MHLVLMPYAKLHGDLTPGPSACLRWADTARGWSVVCKLATISTHLGFIMAPSAVWSVCWSGAGRSPIMRTAAVVLAVSACHCCTA